MSTLHRPGAGPSIGVPLSDGQRLDRATFLALYEQTAPDVKAELIGGVVHMGSPVGYLHGDVCLLAGHWLSHYSIRTPGVSGSLDATTVLDDLGVPQPDLSLRILPEYGGQTHYTGKLIAGAPELVMEVADSSRSVDLGEKRADYERAEVLEYVVVALDPGEVFWYVRRGARLAAPDCLLIPTASTGHFVFPGLWPARKPSWPRRNCDRDRDAGARPGHSGARRIRRRSETRAVAASKQPRSDVAK